MANSKFSPNEKMIPNKNDETKQMTQRALWGASLLTSAGLLFVIVGFAIAEINSWKDYILLGAPAMLFILGLVSIALLRRGEIVLGTGLIFVANLIVPLAENFLQKNIGPVIFIYTLVSSALLIWNILPKSSRRWASILTGAALLFIIGVELVDSPIRVNPANELVMFIFVATAILAAAFIWEAVRASWIGNLRSKLITVFLAITIIPLAIISFITYNSSRTALTNNANQKLANAAAATAQEIDAFIDFNLESVRAAGQYPAVVDYLILPEGQRAGSEEEARALKFIIAISRQDPVFISSVALFDTKGITLVDTIPSDIGSDKSNRTYFQETLSSRLPYVSDVEFSSTSGEPSLYFSAPAHDNAGNVIGVIRIRYDASILQKYIIADTGLAGESSYAVLLDSNHVRLAHGFDRDRVFKSIIPLDPAVFQSMQSKGLLPPGTAQELSTNLPDFERGLNNLDIEPFFAADTNGDGSLEQVSVAPLSTQNWSVAFIQTQEVFLAPITTQTFNNLLIALLVAIIVAVAGFIFAQTLSGPVTRLTQVAEAIAGGDINIQAKVETNDEIGILAGTFNRMTQQLRDFITNLEQRVAARTKDLATVAEVGTATSTILETRQLLQTVVDLTKERFNLYHSHIYLLDEKGENLVLTAGAGEPGRIMASEKRSIPVSREQSLVARAARERKGVTVNDVTQAPDFLANPLLPNTRSELAVPMLVGETLIGVFDIQSDQIGRFTDSDINIQTTLASQLASSVQNARSYESSKSQAEFEALVNTISQKIQRAGSVEDTLQTAVRELGTALGAARVKAVIANRQNDGNVN
jgi:putative methionine-R-sulfoxide reductase with GAF domain